jgi:hypothetical protein
VYYNCSLIRLRDICMLRLFALWIALGSVALGQTVLGVISGRVGDDVDGQPIRSFSCPLASMTLK